VDNSRRIPVNKHKKTGLSTSKEIWFFVKKSLNYYSYE
jgi:hypothetical protein